MKYRATICRILDGLAIACAVASIGLFVIGGIWPSRHVIASPGLFILAITLAGISQSIRNLSTFSAFLAKRYGRRWKNPKEKTDVAERCTSFDCRT